MTRFRAGLGCLVLGVAWLAGCAGDPDRDLALHRAENAVAEGRHDWARIYYRTDLERHPDRLASLRGEALSWLSGYQRSLSSGIEACRVYLERADDPEVAHALVSSLLLLGEWDDARTWAERLDDSVASDLLRAEAWMDAMSSTDANEAERARTATLAALERVFARQPTHPRAHALAMQVAEQAGDLVRAVTHAEAALANDPFDYQTVYQLARLRQRQGDQEAARALLETHQLLAKVQHDGTAAPLPPADALAALEALAPRVASDTYVFQRRLVDARYAAGERGAAESALRTLLDHPEITTGDRQTLATWAGERGSRALSRQIFERVLAADPTNRGTRASLAQLDLDGGDLVSARAHLEAGLDHHPHFARYHALLARVAEAENNGSEALEHHAQAVRLAPFEITWRLRYAELLRADDQIDDLRRLLDDAPEETPQLGAYRARHTALLGD